jgi:heme-degrading monooxygenase HmoA
MIIQIIKLTSDLSEEELLKVAKKRLPRFKAIPGLIQKYYVKLSHTGQYGGVYVWDSRESMLAYKETELASTIAREYKVSEAPEIETMELMFPLR